MEPQQPELKSTTITFMVVVALFYDVVQALLSYLGIGWFIIPVFYFHFWLWFKMHGVKFFTMRRAKGMGIGALLEILTAGIIPAFTFNVSLVALDYKVKEYLPASTQKVISSTPAGKKAA